MSNRIAVLKREEGIVRPLSPSHPRHDGGTSVRRFRVTWLEAVFCLGVVALLAGGTYARNRVWNDEVVMWTDVVRKSPGKARAHSNLGFAYFDAGRYDRALEETEKAIQIDPKLAMAYYVRHLALEKMGDISKAIEVAKKSLEIDPKLHMAEFSLGKIYLAKEEPEVSVEYFRRFLKAYPYAPEVHHLIGVAYATQKRFDKAVSEFESEVRVNPSNSLTHLNLGQIYWFEFRDREKAIRHLKTALFLDPFLPDRAQVQRLVRSLEASS